MICKKKMLNIFPVLALIFLAGCANHPTLPPLTSGEPLEDFTGYARMQGREIISELPLHISVKMNYEKTELHNDKIWQAWRNSTNQANR